MKFICLIVIASTFLMCKTTDTGPIAQVVKKPQIKSQTIQKHIATLAADEYEGRMPCMNGGKKTTEYLITEMKKLGLKPGNNGSYTQEVPLLTLEGDMSEHMIITHPSGQDAWDELQDFVIHSERKTEKVTLAQSELVYCGYGIVDEKKGWNDYEGIDMNGKTAVILINDPGFGGDDPDFFNGDIMTYSGRWDYKYDMADKVGADGLLIIHETNSAAYPWFVVQSSWTGPQQGLSGIDRSQDCGIKGWIHLEKARELFTACGMDLTTEIKAARTPGFKPKAMNAKVDVTVNNSMKECRSNNVIGYIPGTKHPDEYIVYTAHWDHIGIGQVVKGDSIYNGALDNASGVATLLAIAESFTQAPPERSVVFLFVTAEEQGLLGSEYYVENPCFPLEKTVCNINLDGVNPAGKMRDLTITGIGQSNMDEYAEKAAKAQGRYIMPEQEPEKGYFFRSDHFNFAKKGVPALYADGGYDHWEKGKEYAKQFKEDYVNSKYHAPADEYDPATWNIDGMIQDGQLYFDVGYMISNSTDWPEWYPTSDFSRPQP